MNTIKHWMMRAISTTILATTLIGLLAFSAPAPVFAAGGLEETPPPTQPAPDPARLERAYQRMVDGLERQAENLERIDERTADITERIAELKAEGKDVSALEEALAGYQVKVEEAKAAHAEAAAILAAHEGFDADGKVVDAEAARETLKSAGEWMRDAQRDLRPAFQKLLRILREFRRDNRPVQPPQE